MTQSESNAGVNDKRSYVTSLKEADYHDWLESCRPGPDFDEAWPLSGMSLEYHRRLWAVVPMAKIL